MPVFNFKCEKCNFQTTMLVKSPHDEVKCGCGDLMKFQLPISSVTVTLELRDSNRGKFLPKNLEKSLRERQEKYHDKHEISDKIDKYGMKEGERLGWLKKKSPL